jgi:Flp pilus assembly protein TadG
MTHSRTQRLLAGQDRDERGAITVFVVVIFIALIAMAGLVIDGGSALAAKRRAMTTAEQAARVGADALDPASLRSGQPVVARHRAISAAQAYLDRVGAAGRVDVDGGIVTVTVSAAYDTALLSVIGVNRMRVTSAASAVSITEDG